MTIVRKLAATVALAVGLALPEPAAAQFDLGGFIGPVTISHYGTCQDFFCVNAAVGVGQNSSGRYFARLLKMGSSFDAVGFDAVGSDKFTGYGIRSLELWYAEPHPLDPAEGEWHFLTTGGEERYTSSDYGTPIVPGKLLVGYYRSQIEDYPNGSEITTDWGVLLSAQRVTTTPEPMTFGLVAAGLLMLYGTARFRRQA